MSGSLERLERLAEVDDEQSEPRRSIGWLVRPKFDDGARGNRPKGGSHD